MRAISICHRKSYGTYKIMALQVADPAHCSLLKFLFLRSCDPYFGFIRSWIFKAEISDPYKEFMVEYVENLPPNSNGKAGIFIDFALANIRVMLFCSNSDALLSSNSQ